MQSKATERRVWSSLSCAFALLAGHAYGSDDDSALVQELFQTETAQVQEHGAIQLTLRSELEHAAQADAVEVPFLVEYGVTPSLEVELEWNSYCAETVESAPTRGGIGDLEIGAKYAALANENGEVALGLDLLLPTGDVAAGFGEGVVAPEPFVAVAVRIDRLAHLEIFASVGVGFPVRVRSGEGPEEETLDGAGDEIEEEGTPTAEANLGGGFLIPYRDWRFSNEITVETSNVETRFIYTPGIFWSPGGWEVGLGMPLAFARGADTIGAIAMVTYEFDVEG